MKKLLAESALGNAALKVDRLGKVVTLEAKRRAVKHLVAPAGACRLLDLARSVARY